jgi:hypothetical protein
MGKKCNFKLITFFTQQKGHFASGKRALGKTWGGGGLLGHLTLHKNLTKNNDQVQVHSQI